MRKRKGPARRAACRLVVLLLLAATAGCASTSFLGPTRLLERADRQAWDGAWEQALKSYDEYLARFPDDASAPRALESRDRLVAMLTARTEVTQWREEVTRLRDEVNRLRVERMHLREERTQLYEEKRELHEEKSQLHEEKTQLHQKLTRREDALARMRQELAVRRAEAERLRADIERIKEIDLKLESKDKPRP